MSTHSPDLSEHRLGARIGSIYLALTTKFSGQVRAMHLDLPENETGHRDLIRNRQSKWGGGLLNAFLVKNREEGHGMF